MAAISQMTFSDEFREKNCILIKISLEYVPKSPIDNTAGLVEIMAWRRPGNKSLSEPMLTRFADAYVRH